MKSSLRDRDIRKEVDTQAEVLQVPSPTEKLTTHEQPTPTEVEYIHTPSDLVKAHHQGKFPHFGNKIEVEEFCPVPLLEEDTRVIPEKPVVLEDFAMRGAFGGGRGRPPAPRFGPGQGFAPRRPPPGAQAPVRPIGGGINPQQIFIPQQEEQK